MRLSHSHLSVICFVKERKRIIKHFKSLSIKTFLKTSKNQTNCDILISSFNHRQSSEEPNYTPLLKNRQLPNNKKFYKTLQQTEIQELLFQILLQNFQNTINPNPNNPKPSNSHTDKQHNRQQHQRSSEISFRRPLLFNFASYFTNLAHSENICPPEYCIASLTYIGIGLPQNCLFVLYPC